MTRGITVGVLALQGAFHEHIKLLRDASFELKSDTDVKWEFVAVRTPSELAKCDALIIPGGESTTVSLIAERSNLLEPLREFVKYVCVRNCDAEACLPTLTHKWELANKFFSPVSSESPESQYGELAQG